MTSDADCALRQRIATAIGKALDDRLGPDSIAEQVVDEVRPELDRLAAVLNWQINHADCPGCQAVNDVCPGHQGISIGVHQISRIVNVLDDDSELFNDVFEQVTEEFVDTITEPPASIRPEPTERHPWGCGVTCVCSPEENPAHPLNDTSATDFPALRGELKRSQLGAKALEQRAEKAEASYYKLTTRIVELESELEAATNDREPLRLRLAVADRDKRRLEYERDELKAAAGHEADQRYQNWVDLRAMTQRAEQAEARATTAEQRVRDAVAEKQKQLDKAEARAEELAARFGAESTVMTIRGLVCRTCRQPWTGEEADHA